ncbi:MAG: response regulator [Deltaproteobacteria bacterium]|nr:response regulator [Deltaproteobacteria bacterium]
MRQSQKMEAIGTLAVGIAHDFNNILSPVFGYTQMLLEEAPAQGTMRDGLNQIVAGAERAKDLVQQILAFSRQREYIARPVRPQPIIKEVLKLTRASLPATIKITPDIDNDCGLIMADPTQIHQIVMNLITNAFQAMEETGGKLSITLKEIELGFADLHERSMKPGTYVCLTVSDNGPGMDGNIQERIFDPYFTTKKKGEGTGLGLSVVHGIVQNHGGQIYVDSEPGRGSEFKVCLPVIKNQPETDALKYNQPVQEGNERILLVDDQADIVNMEKLMLERMGYHVTARTDSLDVLKTFTAQPGGFDLVITDMTMPGLTGDKLAVELLKIRSDIPIILCTGFNKSMTREKALALGIRGFLMKPVMMKKLSWTIREVLDGKKRSNQV